MLQKAPIPLDRSQRHPVYLSGYRKPVFVRHLACDRGNLTMQVMVAAGTVCVFHVGGCRHSRPATARSAGASGAAAGAVGVPRWEFFIGDRPHTGPADAQGRRQPMVQIAAADKLVQSGEGLRAPLTGAPSCCAGFCNGACAVNVCMPMLDCNRHMQFMHLKEAESQRSEEDSA